MKGAFPDDATNNPSDLVKLGNRLGIEMPDLQDTKRKDIKLDVILRNPENHLSPKSDDPSSSNSQKTEPKGTSSGANSEAGGMAIDGPETAETPPVIRDSSGNEHFIGPSGTLAFFHQLRDVFMSTKVRPAALARTASSKLHHAETLEAGQLAAEDGTNNSLVALSAQNMLGDDGVAWQRCLAELPHPETMQLLIESYFQNTHQDFPLFHCPTFRADITRLVFQAQGQGKPWENNVALLPDWGWLGSLYMVLVLGSMSSPAIQGIDHGLFRKRYVAATKALLPHILAKCTLSNLRVLILLTLFLHNNSERNAAWTLTGTAVRIAFAIGLHRKGDKATLDSPEAIERQYVLSSLYSLELFLASSLGRPASLQEADMEVFTLVVQLQPDCDGISRELISLAVGLNHILERTRLVYSKRKHVSEDPLDSPITTGIDDILSRLGQWKAELKQQGRFDLPVIKYYEINGTYAAVDGLQLDHAELYQQIGTSPRPHLRAHLMLHIQYHYIGIITTRHFLLHDIAAARTNSKPGLALLSQTCVFHSFQLAYVFLLMDKLGLVNGLTGLDIFYGYWAGMLMNLLLLQPPGQEPIKVQTEPGGEPTCFLSTIVKMVQSVITRADKCQTMKRLSSVMDTFVEWAQVVQGNQPAADTVSIPAQPSNGEMKWSEQHQRHQQHADHPVLSVPSTYSAAESVPPAAQVAMNLWVQQNMTLGPMVPAENTKLDDMDENLMYPDFYMGSDDQAAILGMVDMQFGMHGSNGP